MKATSSPSSSPSPSLPASPAPHSAHQLRGVLMVLSAALLWGTTGTAQSLAPAELSPYWVGALRLLVAALFFVPWLVRPRPALPWRGIVAAALCMSVYNLAFFAGVKASGVAVGTAVALGSGPLWAGLLQALISRRAPPLGWWAGACLAVAGVVMMVAGPGAAQAPSPLGLGLCLLAGLSYAVYALVNKHMVAQAPAGVLTAAVFALAAVLALPMAWLLGGPLVTGSAASLAVVVWLGVMSTAVAYLLFTHALQYISSATGVALALGEPVTAFVLAVLVVGERPGWLAFAGLVLVLAGLAVVVRAELRQTTEQAQA